MKEIKSMCESCHQPNQGGEGIEHDKGCPESDEQLTTNNNMTKDKNKITCEHDWHFPDDDFSKAAKWLGGSIDSAITVAVKCAVCEKKGQEIYVYSITETQANNNMKKYLINYYFETWGKIEVEAENKDKAKKMLFKGEFERGEEWGGEYTIKDINIIKED